MTVWELEAMLSQQRDECAKYITRNLSTYEWYNKSFEGAKIDLDLAKKQLQEQANKAPYPSDFIVLKKFLPPRKW